MSRILFFLLFPVLCLFSEPEQVGKWGIFESSFKNNGQFENPYTDVDLWVEFIAPDGRKFKLPGFYDGNSTWKIRFMPGITGKWKYSGIFSDGAEAGAGSFRCILSGLPGMIEAFKPNPVWFGTSEGMPLLVKSFHTGDRFFATNWDDPESKSDGNPRSVFLDWIQEKGYNMLCIGSIFTNRKSEGRGLGWETPSFWPLDASEFRKAEILLDDLAARKIFVFPFAGFFGREGEWPTDTIQQEQYIKYIVARLGAYYNLIWNVAGPEPLLEGESNLKAGYKNQMEVPDIRRIAGLIRKNDVFDHMITVHNQTSASKSGDPFKDEDWYDFSTIQGPKTLNLKTHSKSAALNHHPDKPYLAQETLWFGNMYHPEYHEKNIRKIAITLKLSGASVNFADNSGNSSSGFSGSLDLNDRHEREHNAFLNAVNLFKKLPWPSMKPDTSLFQGLAALRNDAEGKYIVYYEKPGKYGVLVQPGSYRASWIIPVSGIRMHSTLVQVGKEIQTPLENHDWLLFLEKIGETNQ